MEYRATLSALKATVSSLDRQARKEFVDSARLRAKLNSLEPRVENLATYVTENRVPELESVLEEIENCREHIEDVYARVAHVEGQIGQQAELAKLELEKQHLQLEKFKVEQATKQAGLEIEERAKIEQTRLDHEERVKIEQTRLDHEERAKRLEIEERAQQAKTATELGLAMDDWDLDYYTTLFGEKLKRNLTSVECFDLAQSNSEHSRHWFFKGKMIIDGQEQKESLIDMVINTQNSSNQNNLIKFSDNSSAIEGFPVDNFLPKDPSKSSPFYTDRFRRHLIFTAETHNFPTGVAPFSGATTGTGGRLRDVQGTGRGGHVIAGTAGYSFGNLLIPGYDLPWEDKSFEYPSNFASPVEIAIEASNGASDYGNKFGEPVLAGFARSFGFRSDQGERREWIKPIMFSGGIGSIDEDQISKMAPEVGMEVVKIGGPVYRIGVGGGAASSIEVQGDNKAELDFGAVQRGDPEMEQKLNRVIRACLENRGRNPICSIHDQGAGGNGNVLKEIVEPKGAVFYTEHFQLGDPTINTLELWGAEYQESDAILARPADRELLNAISQREKCDVSFVGKVTGDGKVVLVEGSESDQGTQGDKRHPVDLDLEFVLGNMPCKEFKLTRSTPVLIPLSLPEDLTVRHALDRVLRLPSVASKRYLTNKVDRSVTGLVAQQQCVGPLHTPLADVAVVALSYYDTVGGATAIGEQPIKGLLDPAAGARLSVAEAVTNLMFARITTIKDIKCSGNWMWAAKLVGEGAALYIACKAMCKLMAELGIAVDGGKDSLSMAARVGEETVKAPGTLVVSTYAPCPDIRATVTPDLKCPGGKGYLIWVDLSDGKTRLGGTALAQCYGQLGDTPPDLDSSKLLRLGFAATQELIAANKLTAGHDVSDGGFITALLEMAFAGNCGIDVNIKSSAPPVEALFAEEVGWIVETSQAELSAVTRAYESMGVPFQVIGHSTGFGPKSQVRVAVNGSEILRDNMTTLRDVWEETSFQLERRQANPTSVAEEALSLKYRTAPPYRVNFSQPPIEQLLPPTVKSNAIRVAVVREEGTNGDREMAAAFHMAQFEVWDVTMTDLSSRSVSLDQFQGVIFPGGFSYADVLGSAKGWAAAILFNPVLEQQFESFRRRPDTFSLGVCNGCQLLAMHGWVAPDTEEKETSKGAPKQGVHLSHNVSERYESRFTTVRIEKSPAIMLEGMEGSVLGVWVAHGEGRFVFKNNDIESATERTNLVSLRYVDDRGDPTVQYPLNPNGSVAGIAGLCSEDGRHLIMMPHPERCVLPWQWAYWPQDWNKKAATSPWARMFLNAYNWCRKQKS